MNVSQVLINGDIRTQDPQQPRAEALAIRDGRILALGDNALIRRLAGHKTRVIDLGGRLALPGFWDSHIHYYDWAMGRQNLELADVADFPELLEQVRAAAANQPAGQWILGQGWNEADWIQRKIPRSSDLDAVAPNHPVMLWRCDLHLAVVNTRALELAGITDATPDPPEGIIVRDESGHANGILREMAPNLVKAAIPAPSPETVFDAMRETQTVAHSLGLTAIHDIRIPGGVEWIPAFTGWQGLWEAEALQLRVWAAIPSERLDEAIALGLRSGFGDERLKIGYVKFFADGGMGARTAWLIEPYADADYGMPTYPVDKLKADIQRADGAGLSAMIHAIGDRSNRELLRIFEELHCMRQDGCEGLRPAPALPHRIEHVQMIRPDDLERMGQLGLAACVQPHNMILDINMIDGCVGERGRFTYLYRDLLDAGVPLMFSSDCPVCDPSPLVGIHAAVTRQRGDGTPDGGWYPRQRITVQEAVYGYTAMAARCHGAGDELGTLSPGKRADLIVLDQNLFEIDPAAILDTRVEMTLLDGELVYQR